MADLLTHVLVPYVVLTVVGWYSPIDARWKVVAMAGAAIPDLVKLNLLVNNGVVSAMLGHPFSYAPISSIGGVVVIAGAITLLFDAESYRRTYAFLLFGGVSALAVDGLRAFADGYSGFWLYPLWIRPPTPSLYVSSDPRVAASAVAAAVFVFGVDWYRTE